MSIKSGSTSYSTNISTSEILKDQQPEQQNNNNIQQQRANRRLDAEERTEDNVNIGMCTVYTLSMFGIIAIIVYVLLFVKPTDSEYAVEL
eukprot:403353080